MNILEPYADGFGHWHVYIKSTVASPTISARRIIRDSIAEREQRRNETLEECLERLTPYILKNVVRSVIQDRSGYTHFCEIS